MCKRKHTRVRTVRASPEAFATLTRLRSLQDPNGEGQTMKKCAIHVQCLLVGIPREEHKLESD